MILTTREGWGARRPRVIRRINLPAPDVWIHHTAGVTSEGLSAAAEAEHMRGIQNYHMDAKGWSDIGYSFVVFPSGRVYEGRGWGVSGAHTAGHNSSSHGICFAGNYQNQYPTQASLEAARLLIRMGTGNGAIRRPFNIGGHRDVAATACPGKHLYGLVSTLAQPPEPAPEPEPAPPPTIEELPPTEVDGMTIKSIRLEFTTDDNGNGWMKVPYPVDSIIGILSPGLRPAVDGRYRAANVAVAPEGDSTIVSLVGWAPSTPTVVRLRVAS